MKKTEAPGPLEAARTELQEVGRLLRSPSPSRLDECAAALERTAGKLELYRDGLGTGLVQRTPEDLREALLLRTALGGAAKLLQSAAIYHAGWGRVIGALAGGYLSDGSPGAVDPPSRVYLHG